MVEEPQHNKRTRICSRQWGKLKLFQHIFRTNTNTFVKTKGVDHPCLCLGAQSIDQGDFFELGVPIFLAEYIFRFAFLSQPSPCRIPESRDFFNIQIVRFLNSMPQDLDIQKNKNLRCRFWTFNKGFLSMKFEEKNCNIIFQKRGGRGGWGKGCLELFRKFICHPSLSHIIRSIFSFRISTKLQLQNVDQI